jgi:hypothetical protein
MDKLRGVDSLIKDLKQERSGQWPQVAADREEEAYEQTLSTTLDKEESEFQQYQKIQQEIDDKGADISLKKAYGWAIIAVLGLWEVFVIVVTITQITGCSVKISDTVFVALLTSATANILALPTIVLNYLFPKRNNA